MSFNDFSYWYTDTMDIFRVENEKDGSITKQKRIKVNAKPIPCRIYEAQIDNIYVTDTASRERSLEKLAFGLSVDVKSGDELLIIRGGNLGYNNPPERYISGSPVVYYDPVGGVLTGLQHKEVGLLKDNIVR